MQLLILFYVWLVIRVLQLVHVCTQRLSRSKRRSQQLPSVSRDAKLSRHASIIKSISVDFQESQCFFVISIQAALFVALSGDSSVLGATNLTQLGINFAEAKSISSKFILTVTFGLWILHRSHLDSTYILLWSVASIVISTFTLFSKKWELPNNTGIDQISDLDRLDKCGHNPPPLVYCATGRGAPFSYSYWSSGCLVICGALALQKIMFYLCFFLPSSRFEHTIRQARESRAAWILSKLWTVPAEIYLLVINVMFIFSEISQFSQRLYYAPTDWTFGQILAVTIWVPVITRYIYWSICM